MLPEEKYYTELLLSIYPCKVPFTVGVKKDKPRKRLGTYYPKTQRIILHTGWESRYNTTETAIHEYAHHLHYTEFGKEDMKQDPHGKQFWQIYGQLLCRAKELGIFEDDRLPILAFPKKDGTPTEQKVILPEKKPEPEFKIDSRLPASIRMHSGTSSAKSGAGWNRNSCYSKNALTISVKTAFHLCIITANTTKQKNTDTGKYWHGRFLFPSQTRIFAYMKDIFKELNSRQAEAVRATEGRIRVVAGAGTGKTKALTHRYAYLVNVLGIDPANILCLTFTNKAAAQMRSRISEMVQSGDYNDFVCTLHGFCVKFLRREIYRLGFPKSFTVLDEEDSKAIAKQAMDEMGIKRTEKTVRQFLEAVGRDKALSGYIPTYMLPGCVINDEMRRSSRLAGYAARQMKNYALDFDDLMNFTKYILDRFPDACEHWQGMLNYIMVDEAQDCNLDDWDLVERLAARHRNLFVVGDPDQCIYEWRGSRPDLFVNFAADRTIILDENYRSTPRILDVANSVISNNRNRIPKDLFTRKPEGRAVIHFHGRSEKEEMEWIVSQVRTLLGSGAGVNDIAILYRSAYQSRAIEQELLNAHLGYTIWGGTRFFERKEIKDALSYLRLLNNQDDDISFERIINVPSRKLGKAFLDAVRDAAARRGISLYSALQVCFQGKGDGFVSIIEDGKQYALGHRVSDLLNRILDTSGYKRMVREDQDEERLENLDELLSSIRFYESVRTPEESTLSDYLQDVALYTNDDHRRDTPTIKLMTIHQAKGLEFPYVFVIGLSEGIFPNMRTIREGKKNGEEEERRLMYVAVTRAERALFLTESEGFNISSKTNKYPSRFLAEIRKELLVTEGVIPPELWSGTRRLSHVLDEDEFDVGGTAREQSPFKVGDTVTHPVFGEGVIVSVNKDFSSFEVRFDSGSTRVLRSGFLKQADLPE